jgi:hypothetical protein
MLFDGAWNSATVTHTDLPHPGLKHAGQAGLINVPAGCDGRSVMVSQGVRLRSRFGPLCGELYARGVLLCTGAVTRRRGSSFDSTETAAARCTSQLQNSCTVELMYQLNRLGDFAILYTDRQTKIALSPI